MYPDYAWQDSHITLTLNAVRFIKFPHGRPGLGDGGADSHKHPNF
jgi:hypothetical protein